MTKFLLAVLLALPASAAMHVWTGASSNRMSDAANWIGGAPGDATAAELLFPPGPSTFAITNDLPALTVRAISFTGTGYTIGGQPITLAPDAQVVDTARGSNTIETDVQLSGGATLSSEAGGITSSELTLSGAITGTGPVIVSGGSRTIFAGTRPNTYSGGTHVVYGTLRLAKSDHVDAVPGDLDIAASGAILGEGGRVETVANEQIPDSATISLGVRGSMGIGAIETVGPLHLDSNAEITTAIATSGFITPFGMLILAGDITVGASSQNSAQLRGDIALSGMRTVTFCYECPTLTISDLRDHMPGSGLIVRTMDETPWMGGVGTRATYRGPTIVDGGAAAIANPNTAVRLRNGRFAGTVASLIAERGRISGVTTTGDLRLSPLTTVRMSSSASPSYRAGGVVDLAGATLDFEVDVNLRRELGATYVALRNDGPGPIRGTFANVPEGRILADRFRVSYVGGDGNDMTLTEVGRYRTSVTISASPRHDLTPGQQVTLEARVSSENSGNVGNAGQVVFRDGSTIIGTAPLSNGVAELTFAIAGGVHDYSASYEGTATFAPSTSVSTRLEVRPPAPVITSIEPASAQAGSTVDVVVRGTDFYPGGYVTVASTRVETAFVSATEVRFTWHVPRSAQNISVAMQYAQPAPGRFSNIVQVQVTGVPPLPTALTFEPRAVSGSVVPGGGGAWIALLRQPSGAFEVRDTFIGDTDRDGIVRWEQPDDVPSESTWILVDMTDGRISAGTPKLIAPHQTEHPVLFLRDEQENYSRVQLHTSGNDEHVLWVRPGVGAWTAAVTDGGPNDLDGTFNNYAFLDAAKMRPAGASIVPVPPGFQPGDVFVRVKGLERQWFGVHIDEQRLRASDGAGVLRFARRDGDNIGWREGDPVRVPVMRVGGTGGEVSVRYLIEAVTATGAMFGVPSLGTLTFVPGQMLSVIDMPVTDDEAYAGRLTYRITLSNPAGTTIEGNPVHTLRVDDDDPLPRLTLDPPSVTVDEGDEGTRTVQYTVTLDGAIAAPVTATWRSEGVPFSSGTITFVPGEARTQTITVPYAGNTTPDGNRTRTIHWFDVVNASTENAQGRLTIVDDDFVKITLLDATVNESAGSIDVWIAADRSTVKPVTVRWTTRSGTATEGSDFTPSSGSVELALRTTRERATIPIVTDMAAEGDETFTVVLSDATNGTIVRDTATVLIFDDDTARVPAISATSAVAAEGTQSFATFRVRLSFAPAGEVRVRAATVAGTATATTDYTPVDRTLTFTKDRLEHTVSVALLHDGVFEPSEAFTLVLSEPVGATIATPSVTGTILDVSFPPFDPNAPKLTAETTQVAENAGVARLTVRLSRALQSPVTVHYATADGTAFTPDDYSPLSGTLTFAPGETTKTIDVPLANDSRTEDEETFHLVLGNPVNAEIATFTTTVRVRDDDAPEPRRRAAGH